MEVDCYLKMVQQMVAPTNHGIVGAGFTLHRALGTLEIFVASFAKYRRRPKKSHHLSVEPQAATAPYYGKSDPRYYIAFIKALDESLR